MKENLSRRSFIKGAAAGAIGVASMGILEACAPRVAQQAAAENAQAEVKAFTTPTEGKYMTKALGHEDYIYVSTEFRAGAIKTCTVVSHNETMGVGNYACERIPAAIVKNQSVNVPNVRGCSTSSRAIKKAVEEAIRISGHDINKFNKAVTEPDNKLSEEKSVDVVVMGAGTAGLVCAAKLLDQGYSVMVIEKRAIPGGSMAMTYSGVLVADTPTLKNYNVDKKMSPVNASMDGLMAVLTPMTNPKNDRFKGAAPYQRQAYSALGEASEWFKDIGIGFCTIGSFEGGYKYGTTTYLAPGVYMGGSGYAMMALASRIERHPNGKIVYMAKVTEMLQDAATKQVSGVKVVGLKSDDSESGYQLTVKAKAVVLASGGFGKNKDMLAKYYPEHKDFFFNCASESTGEGIQLGMAAGSKMECDGRELPGYLSSTSYFELAFLHYSTPGIMVNATGKSVGNIMSGNHAKMASVALDKANGGKFYYAFDENSTPSTKRFLTYGFNTYEAMFNRGEVLHFNSVADAAKELGLPDLQAAINANNEASLAGKADAFGRTNCPFMDTHNGINVIKVIPTFYLTGGGICIDLKGRVITDSYVAEGQNTAIPGLYACGDVAGSVEEKDGKPYGMGFDMAMGYGYTVAQTIEADKVAKTGKA